MKNTFAEKISNDEVAALPACTFGGPIVVVDHEQDIAAACAELSACPAIGFDTETRPTFRPGALNKVALLQLSTPDKCYLFRLCKIPLDREIIRLLESKTTLKIGADVKGDLRALQNLRHFKPAGFVDLQDHISQWGVAEKSVRKMSAIVLGQRVSKAQRLSNWEAASLTPAQQMYAATDAWICLHISTILDKTEKNPLPIAVHVKTDESAGKKKSPSRRKRNKKEKTE